MRRRGQISDSLELLLDTMCNAFGGIILIALLVTLVARGARMEEQEGAAAEASAEAAGAERLEEAVKRLEEQVTQPEMVERRREQERREKVEEELEKLEAELRVADHLKTNQAAPLDVTEMVKELNRERHESEQALERAEAELERLERQVEAARAAVAEQQRRFSSDQGRDVRQLRLPKEHATGKAPWDVIVRYGQAYFVQYYVNGEKVRNTESISWVADPEGEEALVEPMRGRGLDPERNRAVLLHNLRAVPAEHYYFVFRVYEDSFAAFNALKRLAIEAGHEFSWYPMTNEQQLKAGRRGEAPPPL